MRRGAFRSAAHSHNQSYMSFRPKVRYVHRSGEISQTKSGLRPRRFLHALTIVRLVEMTERGLTKYLIWSILYMYHAKNNKDGKLMKICVFGASSAHIDKIYIQKVEELGERLAKCGHSLVFGAGGSGLMGAAARGFKRGGGHILGIVPSFFRDDGIEQLYEACDEMIFTETMRERKALMEAEADIFVVVPGGIGTFEELFEVLTLKQLNRHDKGIVIFDIDGYYDGMEIFMETAYKRKFITQKCRHLYENYDDIEKVVDYVQNYKPEHTPWQKLKLGD